ncbi:MAG TPA: head GIN domain-containing protein [Flavobacterium sp.]|uniref:head GIN domain-containing protein n=1 Tax=unclassified Flavobacterium TaxID=196869 RepID=UPI000E88C0EA|nr:MULTISPECIES: head GIN domain-containing protein [unclassified Flavobacterium]HBI01948.1 DUF2807 domain-containing protein [Flavobacterium sp.]HRE77409.1 head GIN domain-containing protein [Flavobacterium sp.]
MKKIILIIVIASFFYNCEKPGDCIKSTGEIITREVEVTPFETIFVYTGIELVIKQGPEYKVEVKSGENLIDDIEVKIENNTLSLKDKTTCNWVRDYGQTIVYVTAPNLTDIHSKTEQAIKSDGLLTYPIIRLYAMDLSDGAGTGDFIFEVDNGQLVILNNNVSRFFISGNTQEALLNFYDGNGRLEAQDLAINVAKVFHRGSNDMIIRPIQSVEGDLFSTGNLILLNTPPTVNLTEHYQGRVIYN